jgi:hypothetical protein
MNGAERVDRDRASTLAGAGTVALGLALACLSAPLAAQRPIGAPAQEIVVEGRQEQALRNFVAAMTDPRRSRQIARWNGEICPTVVGVDARQAAFMARRIGEIAVSLRLRARSEGCLTTMLILVSTNAPALAASLARNYPIALRADGRSRLNRFVASTRPVRWLSVTDDCGFEGCSLPNSRLSRATRPQFQAMIVIVDAQQIGEFSLGELTDYVSVVALANPSLHRRWPSTSILSMFEEDRPPGFRFGLTDYDRSYLTGLYRTRIDGSGQEQRASIVRQMEDAQDRR